jgi:hypothetical protein
MDFSSSKIKVYSAVYVIFEVLMLSLAAKADKKKLLGCHHKNNHQKKW